MRKNLAGQSLFEYILLFTIVVAALLIMGYYIRNSLSGKYRDASDVFGQGENYVVDQRP